jgi:hypothetical protein
MRSIPEVEVDPAAQEEERPVEQTDDPTVSESREPSVQPGALGYDLSNLMSALDRKSTTSNVAPVDETCVRWLYDRRFDLTLQLATFAFEARNTDELSFNIGDKITIVTKCDGGWWEGCIGGLSSPTETSI